MRTQDRTAAAQRRLPRLAGLWFSGALTLTGCVKMEQTLTLSPDGGGRLEARYRIREAALRTLPSPSDTGSRAVEAPIQFDPDLIRENFAEYEAHGVRLVTVETRVDAGFRFLRLVLDFDHLEGISRTPFFVRSELSLRRVGEGRVQFRQSRSPPVPGVADPLRLSDPLADPAVRDQLRGLHITLTVEVPGAILTANTKAVRARAADWVFDLDRDPEAARRLDQALLLIEFDGTGLQTVPEFGRQYLRLLDTP